MFSLTIEEDGIEAYHSESEDLILAVSNNDYILKGYGSVSDLLDVSIGVLLFIFETIKNETDEDYSLFEYLNEIIQCISEISRDESDYDRTILKCSDPKDLTKAVNLAKSLYEELKNKLPNNYNFTGLDYDEFKRQTGEEDNENN